MAIIGQLDTDRPDWMRASNGRQLHLWIRTVGPFARSSAETETLCGVKGMTATHRGGRHDTAKCAKCEAALEKAKGGA